MTIAAIVAFVAAGGALAMAWRVGALSAFSESSTDTATTAPAASGAGKRSVTAVNEGGPQVLPTTSKSGSVDPVGRVVDALRRRRWARIGLSAVSVGLMIGGLAMVGYPVYTNFYADRKQAELERQLASSELEEAYRRGTVEEGDSLTRIIIPALDVDVVVVEGVGASALRAGAGHYPKTALPCEVGNVAIAGHRTTYGRPFHNLDLLDPGDTIILKTP
ncbi:MAG TPA: sortase, partial [Acidimicrobiales bacterium]